MKKASFPLIEARVSREVVVLSVSGGRGMRTHLHDMGLFPGAVVRLVNPGRGGPCIVQAGDGRLAIGHGIARRIIVTEMTGGAGEEGRGGAADTDADRNRAPARGNPDGQGTPGNERLK